MEERLGKIERASFGLGGYQEAEIGLSVTLGDGSWGVQDWKGTWAMKRSDHCEWKEEERIKILCETVMFLNDLLKKAKVFHNINMIIQSETRKKNQRVGAVFFSILIIINSPED